MVSVILVKDLLHYFVNQLDILQIYVILKVQIKYFKLTLVHKDDYVHLLGSPNYRCLHLNIFKNI